MTIEQIRQLRKERKNQVESLKSQINSLDHDDRYSPAYKMEQKSELTNRLTEIRQRFDNQIDEIITNLRNDLVSRFDQAEYKELKPEEAIKELLLELKSQEEASYLAKVYQDKHEALLFETEKLVNVNSPKALAYIKAMKKLGAVGATGLEQQYKKQNLNSLQKAIQSDLNVLENEAQAYEIEKTEEVAPLKAAILDHYKG